MKTANYSFEFVSARTFVGQIIDLWNTLCSLGVSISQKSYMFGDKKYFVVSAIHPHDNLHNSHTVLCFHQVLDDITPKMVAFHHVSGGDNTSDIISKHWS